MLTIQQIKADPERVIKRLAVKGFDASEIIPRVIELDDSRRALQLQSDNKAAELNRARTDFVNNPNSVIKDELDAAIAAARAGCNNIVLMERYGYSGGDVTGGYVIMVPNLSWYDKSFVRGLQEEWFTRLAPIPGAGRGPALKDTGSPSTTA